MSMYIGEALAGDGNEVAHIDLMIGSKDGPVGHAFASALANQTAGHSNLLAVLEPNLAVKPSTVTITKVTIKNSKQAVQMFGPAQAAVAKAVADAVEQGVIPKDQCEDLVIVCGVFIHWEAQDDKKIYDYNYEDLNPYDYQYHFGDDIDEQLFRAGIQLANLLNRIM